MSTQIEDIQSKRAKLFANLCQGKIKKYSLRMDGNRIVFESYKEVVRETIKIGETINEIPN